MNEVVKMLRKLAESVEDPHEYEVAADEIERLTTAWRAEMKLSANLQRAVERLKDSLRASYGGCCMLSQGDACDCGLCKRDREIARLKAGVTAVQSLINESQGVAGLHLNGDLAPWDELLAGGRFEEWLRDFSEAARAAGGE